MSNIKRRRKSPRISADELPTKNNPTRQVLQAKIATNASVKKTISNTFSDGFDLPGISRSSIDAGSRMDNEKSLNETAKQELWQHETTEEQREEEEEEGRPVKRLKSVTPSLGGRTFVLASKSTSAGSMPSFRDNQAIAEEEDDEVQEAVPWTEKYAPHSSSAVALHVRKVKEVRDALEDMCSDHPSIKLLILSGPAGSSKSSILRALARETLTKVSKSKGRELSNNYLLEWENPDRMEGRSLPAAFLEFLSSAKYKTNRDSLILVDDIPNLSHLNTRELFNMALLEWINREDVYTRNFNPGLVLIITEIEVSSNGSSSDGNTTSFRNAESLITERVVSEKVLHHKSVKRIKFRPVNKTLSTKALKAIVDQERSIFRRISPQDVTKAIDVISDYGDIRSAIMSLEFWAIGRSRSLSRGVTHTKQEQGGQDVYLNMLRRDAHLDLFHAVGKVVHLSSKDKFSNEALDDDAVVDGILADWSSNRGDQQVFSSTVFENFVTVNKYLPLADICECVDTLCTSDLLTANTLAYGGIGNKQCTEIACNLDIRSVRETLKQNKHLKAGNSFAPLSFPRTLKKQAPEIKQLKLELDEFRAKRLLEEEKSGGSAWSYEGLLLYEKYYSDIIVKNKQYQLRAQEMFEESAALQQQQAEEEVGESDFGSDFDAEIEDELDKMLVEQEEASQSQKPQVESAKEPTRVGLVVQETSDFSDDFSNDEYDEQFANLL